MNKQQAKRLLDETFNTQLDKEIDQLVYKLYEQTPDEIKIVERFGK